jgi:hypothetical protein
LRRRSSTERSVREHPMSQVMSTSATMQQLTGQFGPRVREGRFAGPPRDACSTSVCVRPVDRRDRLRHDRRCARRGARPSRRQLTPGKDADLIVVRADGLGLSPLNHPYGRWSTTPIRDWSTRPSCAGGSSSARVGSPTSTSRACGGWQRRVATTRSRRRAITCGSPTPAAAVRGSRKPTCRPSRRLWRDVPLL